MAIYKYRMFPLPLGPPHYARGGVHYAPDEGGVEPLPASNLNRLQPMKPLLHFMARGGEKEKTPSKSGKKKKDRDLEEKGDEKYADIEFEDEEELPSADVLEHEYVPKRKPGLAPGPDYRWDAALEKWVPKKLAYSHVHYEAPKHERKLTVLEKRLQREEMKRNPLYRPGPKGPIGAGIYAKGGVISLPASNLDRLLPMKRKGGKICV